MSLHPIGVNGSDTTLRPSNTIWGKCPVELLKTKSIVGGAFHEDFFSSFNITPATTEGNWTAQNGYSQFSDTGGFITAPALSAATASGVPLPGITIGSNDDNEGVSIRTLATQFALNRACEALWFEACIKKSSIANTIAEVFVGLMENTSLTAIKPITTTAATLADVNIVGFYSTESNGAKASTTYKANGVTAVVVGADEVTFVANTYTKLGMRYIRSGDKNGAFCLNFYQDGVILASYKQLPASGNGTDFPNDVSLGPVIAIRNAAGSSPGDATLAWWRCAQLYAPLT